MQSIEHPYMLAFQSTPLMRGETDDGRQDES